jgi:ribosomal protein L32
MAVPKRKVGPARRDKRRSAVWKLSPIVFADCPHCHQPKLPHRVCKSCGYYKGEQVIQVEKIKAE